MSFGEQLQKLIKLRGVSVYGVSKATGIQAKLLHDYIQNGVDPGFSKVAELAKYFEVSPNYFFSKCSPEVFIAACARAVPMGYLLTLPKEKLDVMHELILGYARDFHRRLSDEKFLETARDMQLASLSNVS